MASVYKIVSDTDPRVYVGSTKEKLGKRLRRHKYKMLMFPHRKLYQAMSVDTEHWRIECVQEYENISKKDLFKAELRAMCELNATLNMKRPISLPN